MVGVVLGEGGDVSTAALGRLTQASDDDSIVQFTYDSPSLSRSRALTETQGANPLGTTGKTVTTTLDAEGNQTEIDYPSGFEAHRTFDELNRLTLLEDSSSNDIASWTRYGAANRRDVLSYENGTTTTWGWDGFRRPTTITHEDSGCSYPPASPTAGCVAFFRAPHGGSDNPTFEARTHQSGKGDAGSPRFGSYDRANRLTKVLQDVDDPANEVANPGAEAYGDKVPLRSVKPQHGRRAGLASLVTTPYGGSGSTVRYSTNAMNEYTSVGGTSHSYDDNGNLVDDGTYEYVYDAHNHVSVTNSVTTGREGEGDAEGDGSNKGQSKAAALLKLLSGKCKDDGKNPFAGVKLLWIRRAATCCYDGRRANESQLDREFWRVHESVQSFIDDEISEHYDEEAAGLWSDLQKGTR